MCDYWESTEELAKKVAIALPKTFRRNPRVGWVRADKAASPAITEELAKLSKENRELREDYEQLKATITDSKPSLGVLLNGEKQVSLKYKEWDFSKLVVSYPQKIEYSQIAPHLQPYISRGELDKYNSSLPANKIIDIYNTQVERYFRFKKTGQKLSISVINDGTTKANEVFIELEFPEQLLVEKNNDKFQESMPDNPIPDSPIQKAEEKYKREHGMMGMQVGIGYLSGLAEMQRSLSTLPNIQALVSRVPPDYSSRVADNVIHIKMNGLLHTRKRHFDDFIISPLADGDYSVKASIICAEYKTPEIYEIPIKVAKK